MHVPEADLALSMLVEAGNELKESIVQVNQRGQSHPTCMQLQSFGERAVLGAMIEMPWARAFSPVPPHERFSFAHFCNQWAAAIERAANIKQGGGESNAA